MPFNEAEVPPAVATEDALPTGLAQVDYSPPKCWRDMTSTERACGELSRCFVHFHYRDPL